MVFFHKNELKFLWPFYLEAFLGTILFIQIPFAVLYFSSIGFSAAQVGLLMAIVPLAAFISEIPTGAIADLYGRKFSVILGWLLEGTFMLLFFFTRDYYHLIIISALIGISTTLMSGSYEAWVVDLLKAKKHKNLIKNYFSKKPSCYNLAFVFSGIFGAWVVGKFGLAMIWPLSAASAFVTASILLFGEEIYKTQKAHIKKSFINLWNQAKETVSHGYGHHVLYYLMIISFGMSLGFAFQNFITLTPILTDLGFTSNGFGYLWSAMAVVGIFAPLVSHWSGKNNEKNALIIIYSLIALYTVIMQFAWSLTFVLILIIVSSFIWDTNYPFISTYFHRFIPTKMRATMGSIRGMMISLGGIVGLPLAGLLVDLIGPRYTLLVSGLFMLVSAAMFFLIKEK